MTKYYNSRVKSKVFQVGDLVLRESKVFQPTEVKKLSSKWEGPYVIIKVIRPGAYQLQRPDGSLIPHEGKIGFSYSTRSLGGKHVSCLILI